MYWTTHLRFALILFGATSLEIPARKKGETKLHKLLKQAKCSHRANIQHKLKWVRDEPKSNKILGSNQLHLSTLSYTEYIWKTDRNKWDFCPVSKGYIHILDLPREDFRVFFWGSTHFKWHRLFPPKLADTVSWNSRFNYSGKYHSQFKIFWIKIMVNISSG